MPYNAAVIPAPHVSAPLPAVPQTPEHVSPAMPAAPQRPPRRQLIDVPAANVDDEADLFVMPPPLARCQLVFPDSDDEEQT
jgi:hypothetical protein